MKRQTNYFTLVSLIGQYRRGMGKFLTALDYYIDYCDWELDWKYGIVDVYGSVFNNCY